MLASIKSVIFYCSLMKSLVVSEHVEGFFDGHPDSLIICCLLAFCQVLHSCIFDQLTYEIVIDVSPVQEELFDRKIFFRCLNLHAGLFEHLTFAAFRICLAFVLTAAGDHVLVICCLIT